MNRLSLLVPTLIMPLTIHAQSMLGNEKCQALVQEGMNLLRQNKFNEALAKFQKAEQVDPYASAPLSGRALALYSASQVTFPENVQKYRQDAEGQARAALERNSTDLVAQEVLRLLTDGPDKERHIPNEQARAALDAGENLYHKKQFDAALDEYNKAFQLDPAYAEALVYAGDCKIAQGKHAEAEGYFRRAIAVDPLYERGWRFLADALLKQNKIEPFREALVGAISARPTYKAAWDNLSDWGKASGSPLKTFRIKPMAKAVVDEKTKKSTVIIDQGFLAGEDKNAPSPDLGVWVMYGLVQASKDLPPKKGEKIKSAFETELETWDKALKVGQELETNTKRKLRDPALIQMNAFATSGDLKAAIFLFMYKEAFRPDFEAWKKENSGAIKAFIEKYSLRP